MSANLTPAEIQTIKNSLDGGTAKDIARKLGVGFRTIETHISNIYSKTGITNRLELVRWAIKNDLVTVEEFLNA